jgi:predicted nuclease with TOPRIM domain
MLNSILYSKLPNILQSGLSQKHLVLTINPIIDLYEDCKNTLSTTLCKNLQDEVRDENEPSEYYRNSPAQELNDSAKKRIEVFEKQSEDASLKIRKLEEEINYYKVRFDELEFRLKNLLNTHSAQVPYHIFRTLTLRNLQ